MPVHEYDYVCTAAATTKPHTHHSANRWNVEWNGGMVFCEDFFPVGIFFLVVVVSVVE